MSASPNRPTWAPTACERLRHFMELDRWYAHHELEAVGGRRFPARLHEIARGAGGAPLAYDCRAISGRDGAFEYRLREYAFGEAMLPLGGRKKRARERIEELARENAALKARIAQLEGGAAHG